VTLGQVIQGIQIARWTPVKSARGSDAPQRMGLRWRVLVWALMSAAFTGLIIQYSYSHGRLACPPYYDDVSYFEDALHRLAGYYSGGFVRVLSDYRAWPPHSPFSSFLALIAYAFLGIHDWAPYVANGLVIFGLLLFLDLMGGGLTLGRKIFLAMFVLTIPVASEAVFEFRPDVPSALFAAMGAMLMVRRSLSKAGWKYQAAAGALFGLALLAKPPTSPLTLAVFFVALGVGSLIDWYLTRPAWDRLARAWGCCTAAMVLIPLPHYLLTWRVTWEYIYTPIFGSTNAIWRSAGTPQWHMEYYLTGDGGQFMFGLELPVLLWVIGLGLLAMLLLRRWTPALRALGILAIALVAYAIPTAMSVKQRFFGATLAWIVVLAAADVLARLLRRKGWVPIALFALAMLCALRQARLGPELYARGSAVVLERNRVTNDIYNALRAQHITPHTRIYMTTTGYLNAGVLDYFYRRDTLHAMNIGENSFSGDVNLHRREIDVAEYVIASEPGNSDAFDFPSGTIQGQTLALVREDADFEQIGAFPTLTGKPYFLFRRARPFCGWQSPRGLIEAQRTGDGSTAFVGLRSGTRLTIPAGSMPKLCLLLRGHSQSPGLPMRVLVDGRIVARDITFGSDPDEELAIPFTIRGGGAHQLEIRYRPPQHAAPVGPAVLFNKLEIVPDELK